MSNRSGFFVAVFGVALVIFLAQSTEYRGADYMAVAGYVALAGGLGTLALLILAVRMFKTAETGGVVLSACVCAALPFVVTWLLSVNGTQLNVHGFAILGFFIYALGSCLCAIGLLIAAAVRASTRSKRRAI